MLEFCSHHLVCPPPSRLVGLLVENRSLYATYGKKYGMFLDNPHSDHWQSTWQLAVNIAESMRFEQSRDNFRTDGRKTSTSRNTWGIPAPLILTTRIYISAFAFILAFSSDIELDVLFCKKHNNFSITWNESKNRYIHITKRWICDTNFYSWKVPEIMSVAEKSLFARGRGY